jgi:hypothetical protein
MPTFSQRHGLDLPDAAEITVRHDAPDWLREVVVHIASECGWNPGTLRSILCTLLRYSEVTVAHLLLNRRGVTGKIVLDC